MSRVYSIISSLSLLVLVLDQWTKQIAVEALQVEGASREVFSWWNWTLVYNRAAAFGLFGNIPLSGALRTAFFVSYPIIIVGILWWFIVRDFKKDEIFKPITMGLVFGGALGNWVDRIRYGYVVDFADWFYPTSSGKCIPLFHLGRGSNCHWPVFNVADVAVCFAIFFVFIDFIREIRSSKKSK